MAESAVAKILSALKDVGESGVAEVDKAVAALQGELARLRRLRNLLAPPPTNAHRKPGPKKREPVEDADPEEHGAVGPAWLQDLAAKVVRHLAAKGCQRQKSIAEALGVPQSNLSRAMSSQRGWFVETAAGYVVTPAARQAVL